MADLSIQDAPRAGPRPIAWADGRVVPAADATVPLTDDGFLRGDAVFDAAMVRGGRTHALDLHLQRLRRSGNALGIRIPALGHVVRDLLAAWGDNDGAIKLVVTRSGTVRGLIYPVGWPATISVAVVEAPWRTALAGVKTTSYVVNQWAHRQAVAREADDAVIVDDGVVHELPTGSLCLVRDGQIVTPDPARLPILDSVTIRVLAEVVAVERAVLTVDDLRAADELFVVSATRPVLPVDAVLLGDDEIDLVAPGTITTTVGEAFSAHVDDNLDPLL